VGRGREGREDEGKKYPTFANRSHILWYYTVHIISLSVFVMFTLTVLVIKAVMHHYNVFYFYAAVFLLLSTDCHSSEMVIFARH